MDLHEEIARIAYELFERDGSQHGKDVEHWREAERLVRARHAAEEEKGRAEKTEKAAPRPEEKSTGKAPLVRKRQARSKGEPPSTAGGRAKRTASKQPK